MATSPAGVAEKDYDVTVNKPPTINDRGNDVTAVVGENVTLECKSDAYPPPYLSWFKDGADVSALCYVGVSYKQYKYPCLRFQKIFYRYAKKTNCVPSCWHIAFLPPTL